MLEQDFLDLAWVYVRAAGDDQILGTVLEVEIAVAVEGADIAGMEPAAFQRGCARLRISPIARHHDVAPAQDFAALAGGYRPVLSRPRSSRRRRQTGGRPTPAAPASADARGRRCPASTAWRSSSDFRPGHRFARGAVRSAAAPRACPRHTWARRPRSACGCTGDRSRRRSRAGAGPSSARRTSMPVASA